MNTDDEQRVASDGQQCGWEEFVKVYGEKQAWAMWRLAAKFDDHPEKVIACNNSGSADHAPNTFKNVSAQFEVDGARSASVDVSSDGCMFEFDARVLDDLGILGS